MGVMHCEQPHQSPSSKLNPNAPIFVPMKSYLTVEDFSDQWWDLVHSSPFFRDYWLQDCFEHDYSFENDDFTLPDSDDAFDLYFQQQLPQEEREEDERSEKELISLASLKWSKSPKAEAPRSFEKVPKIVRNVRPNPRTIHQPR
ncbi:hypothetical protein RND81_03G162000 [Saponaria officinalis]|uniref:Ataxin-2 C-terminal domain-containing protein n=1 Tax=Saponaria officinalis TaxID=3572 RepID=A0AAW1M0V4_SAPOF